MIDVQQHAGDSAAAVAADAATGSSLPPSSAAAAVHASRASAEVSRDGKVLEPAEGDAAAAARASSEGPMAGEGAGGGGGGAPSFSTALATWRAIALTELQKELDAQAVEVVDGQRESVVGRKRLAEQTRGECESEMGSERGAGKNSGERPARGGTGEGPFVTLLELCGGHFGQCTGGAWRSRVAVGKGSWRGRSKAPRGRANERHAGVPC